MNFKLHPDLTRDGILVGRFPLCQVLLINDCNYPWFVLVPEREDICDTIDLTEEDHQTLWKESHIFGAGIMEAYAGEKLNVAALGNITPQLHVHHIVRYSTDAAWPGAIWGKLPLQPYPEDRLNEMLERLIDTDIAGFDSR